MREVKLPSGAVLQITLPPFADSKELYQTVVGEFQRLGVSSEDEMDVNLWKNVFCTFVSSKKVEVALQPCLARATYNGLKIDVDTFEPVEARGDYLFVCYEVAMESVHPFAKSLYAKFETILKKLKITLP